MRVRNIRRRLGRKLGMVARYARAAAGGAAILVGAMMFAGEANAGVILTEDFEGSDAAWSGSGWDTLSGNYSGSPHSGVPGGLTKYGWNPGGSGGAGAGSTSQTIDLAAGQTDVLFDGWLASYTSQGDTTVFRAEFFSAAVGGGSSLGSVILANGFTPDAAGGVTEYVDGAGAVIAGDAGSNVKNWSHFITSNPIPVGTLSVIIRYNSEGPLGSFSPSNAYADEISISTTIVPEPGTASLLAASSLMLIGFGSRRRKKT